MWISDLKVNKFTLEIDRMELNRLSYIAKARYEGGSGGARERKVLLSQEINNLWHISMYHYICLQQFFFFFYILFVSFRSNYLEPTLRKLQHSKCELKDEQPAELIIIFHTQRLKHLTVKSHFWELPSKTISSTFLCN